jgi:hypothetical protein
VKNSSFKENLYKLNVNKEILFLLALFFKYNFHSIKNNIFYSIKVNFNLFLPKSIFFLNCFSLTISYFLHLLPLHFHRHPLHHFLAITHFILQLNFPDILPFLFKVIFLFPIKFILIINFNSIKINYNASFNYPNQINLQDNLYKKKYFSIIIVTKTDSDFISLIDFCVFDS